MDIASAIKAVILERHRIRVEHLKAREDDGFLFASTAAGGMRAYGSHPLGFVFAAAEHIAGAIRKHIR